MQVIFSKFYQIFGLCKYDWILNGRTGALKFNYIVLCQVHISQLIMVNLWLQCYNHPIDICTYEAVEREISTFIKKGKGRKIEEW